MLVEGRWETEAGLTAVAAEEVVRTACSDVTLRPMPESIFWGKDVRDERYLLVGHR